MDFFNSVYKITRYVAQREPAKRLKTPYFACLGGSAQNPFLEYFLFYLLAVYFFTGSGRGYRLYPEKSKKSKI